MDNKPWCAHLVRIIAATLSKQEALNTAQDPELGAEIRRLVNTLNEPDLVQSPSLPPHSCRLRVNEISMID